MMVEERNITKALAGQKPPRQPTAKLPTCQVNELPQPASYAEACASEHADVWGGAMAKEFNGLAATGTFGTA